MSLSTTLQYMFPALVPNVDYVLQDDGAGAFIKKWTNTTITQPTATAISNATPAADLWAAQVTQISILAAAYANAIVQSVSYTSKAGVVQTYQADAHSVANLQSMMLAFSGAAATPTGFPWFALDNTPVPFAYADLQGLAAVIGTQGLAAFLNLQAKKAAVMAAPTIAKVQGVVW